MEGPEAPEDHAEQTVITGEGHLCSFELRRARASGGEGQHLRAQSCRGAPVSSQFFGCSQRLLRIHALTRGSSLSIEDLAVALARFLCNVLDCGIGTKKGKRNSKTNGQTTEAQLFTANLEASK